jgi:magnesium-transporting ATPase (P-type)
MVVVAVGLNTQYGIIKEMTSKEAEDKEPTPLQEKLDRIAKCVWEGKKKREKKREKKK